MVGMWIVHADVSNAERYAEYAAEASGITSRFGSEYIARGGRYVHKEGKEFRRHALVRYPSFERAVEAYESPEYQTLLGIVAESSDRHFTIVEVND